MAINELGKKTVTLEDFKKGVEEVLIVNKGGTKGIITLTLEEYDALTSYDEDIEYHIIDDEQVADYEIPVGGVLESVSDKLPIYGTWEALPDKKEWDDVNETILPNPTGCTGTITYSVHNNICTIKFERLTAAEAVHNYFYNIPKKYEPDANQLCGETLAWDDNTTRIFICINNNLPEGNVYVRRVSTTSNNTWGYLSYPCFKEPDRVLHRWKRIA